MSQKNTLTEQDFQKWSKNLLKFSAPALVIFFGQLAIGVDWRAALAVALLALYGAIADLISKYKSGIDPSNPVEVHSVPTDVQQTAAGGSGATDQTNV